MFSWECASNGCMLWPNTGTCGGCDVATQRETRTSDADLDWVVANLSDLGKYSGRWIAVLARTVVACGTTAGEVVDDLAAREIVDALVTRIPDDLERRSYLIA